jgi:hypothetical protein
MLELAQPPAEGGGSGIGGNSMDSGFDTHGASR